MKKNGFVIFFSSFILLIGFIGFFSLQENNQKGTASGDADTGDLPSKTVSIVVQDSESLVIGQSKQLFLTYEPKNASINIYFDAEGIVEIDGSYMLTAIGEGQTNCVIEASYLESVSRKIVEIVVENKVVSFESNKTVFFSGANDYELKISSNLAFGKNQIIKTSNVEIKSFTQHLYGNFFVADILFSVASDGYFCFELFSEKFDSNAIKKPVFEKAFYENNVFDSSSNLITLYSNITNQAQAQENGFSKQATFVQDLTSFDIVIKNNQILDISQACLVAKEVGSTYIEVFSKIDEDFYLKFNIVVNKLSLQSFDVFVNNEKVEENTQTSIFVGDEIDLQIKNIKPAFANFDNEQLNVVSNDCSKVVSSDKIKAISAGMCEIDVELGDFAKTIYFNILPLEEDPQQDIVVLSVSGIYSSFEIVYEQTQQIYVQASKNLDVFALGLKVNNQVISSGQFMLDVLRNDSERNKINLVGSQLEVKLFSNCLLKVSYDIYEFVFEIVLV